MKNKLFRYGKFFYVLNGASFAYTKYRKACSRRKNDFKRTDKRV